MLAMEVVSLTLHDYRVCQAQITCAVIPYLCRLKKQAMVLIAKILIKGIEVTGDGEESSSASWFA